MTAPLTLQQQEDAYLARLGERVRAWRTEHGMSRKALALASGVSERYLAQLEAGRGNISVLLLRKLARAMGVAVERLVREDDTVEKPIALIGLRGAGKSTLGAKLAASLSLPLVELDREVEKEAGAPLAEVFAMYGQDAFRRFERRALERVLAEEPRAVIATGGGAFMREETRSRIRDKAVSIWLKADVDVIMKRVKRRADRPLLHRIVSDRDENGAVRRLALVSLRNGSPQRETVVILDGLAANDDEDRELRAAAKRVAELLRKKGR